MRSIRISHGCVCVLQTNLAQVKASNLKNMPVFEAQTTGMCKTFLNLLHRHVYTTFTDLSCCYVIDQGTYPGFIRHAPLEIHALLVDWLQPQKNQEVPAHNILTRKLSLRESNLNHLTNHHRVLSRDREKYFRLHAKKKPFSRGVSLHVYVHVLKYKSIYSFTITHIISCYTRSLHHRALIGRPLALSDNKDIPPASAKAIYIPNVDEIACMRAWMYECMYVCMHVCLSVCLTVCPDRGLAHACQRAHVLSLRIIRLLGLW